MKENEAIGNVMGKRQGRAFLRGNDTLGNARADDDHIVSRLLERLHRGRERERESETETEVRKKETTEQSTGSSGSAARGAWAGRMKEDILGHLDVRV